MTPRAISAMSPDHIWARDILGLVAIVVLLAAVAVPASAQRYVGSNSLPNVTVDYSVLDELGSAPNVPQLFLQNPTGSAYRNNPYRGQPRFPVVRGGNDQVHTERIVLTPPAAAKPRPRRQAVQPTARPATPPVRRPAVRRAPVRPQQPTARIPRPSAPPPPPAVIRAPAPVVPPPPAGAAVPQKPTAIEPPVPKKAVPAPPKIPEPPPLPPVTTAPEPKQIARTVAPPPPAPPKVTTPAVPNPPKKVEVPPLPKVAPAPVKPRPTPPRAKPRAASPEQVAALPSSTPSVRSGSLRRIEFPPGSAKLTRQASVGLKNVAAALASDRTLRIQLLAYAGQSNDSASQARRLSLSRALAARSNLIEQGVRSTRIDVRALGNKSAGGPADRIDIIVTKR